MKKIMTLLTILSLSSPAFSLVSNVCSEDSRDPHYLRSISDPSGDTLKTRIEICAHGTHECQQVGQNPSYNFSVVKDVQSFQSKYLRNTVGKHIYDAGKGVFAITLAIQLGCGVVTLGEGFFVCVVPAAGFMVPALAIGVPAVVVNKQLFGDDSEKAYSSYRRAAVFKQLLTPDADEKYCHKLKFPNLVETEARDIGKLLDNAKEEAQAFAKLKQEQEHAAEQKQREQYRQLSNGSK